MTEPAVPDDGIVRTALQLLPVPAHTDGFWERLGHALDSAGEPGPAVTAGDVFDVDHDPALALVPATLRRRSNAALLAVAAATVAVVVLAGNALVEQREGTNVTAEGDQPSAALEALVSDAQPGPRTSGTMSADGEDASTEAVLAWVEDLGSGDSDAAWAALGPASKAHFGSQAAFEGELSTLAEGYGAWTAAEPEDVFVTPILAGDEGTVAVVTLVGTVGQDGPARHRAVAFPVRLLDGGEVHLEPFAFAGELEIVVPEAAPADGAGPPVEDDEELVIVVPADAEAPILRIDDGEAMICGLAEGTELTPLDGVPGQRCSYLPSGPLDPGEHTLTTAFMGSDGSSISATSLVFEAA